VALAPFFDRVYGAVGGHLSVSREALTASLENVTVGVRCGGELSPNDVWIAELSTNLLARLYPRLAISGPGRLCSSLRDLASKINPNIEFIQSAPGPTTICVGFAEVAGALFPSATGWVARLGEKGHLGSGPANPYAAAAAAAFAAAELFRRIFLKTSTELDFALSLLNFDDKTGAQTNLPASSLGDVIFVGLGAVGNAALWTLARDEKRKGRLWLIDNEELEFSNLQRYVLGTAADVARHKVLLGKEALAKSQMSVETAKATLEDFAQEKGGLTIPTLCISVDNVPTRRAAQALLPRLAVNGWTGDRALGSSWHVVSRKAACLACLYHPHAQGPSQTDQAARALGLTSERAALLWVTRQPLSDDDIANAAGKFGVDRNLLEPWRGKTLGDMYTDVVCGAVPINLPVTGRVETVPLAHQSALAGILMAAELVKRTNPTLSKLSQPEPLVSWDDVLRPPPVIWPKPMARVRGCICGDEVFQTVYRKKWKNAGHYGSRKRSPL
jgi:hypothetical protein